MTAVIATSPKFQFSGADGLPLINGTLTTYLAGTTTPTTTWQDRAQATANTNPIVLDGNGECLLWLDPLVTYKFVLANAEGTQQWSVDNISGAEPAGLREALAASSGSSLVGYISGGTGAVATTVQAKLRRWQDVMDKGADNTGSVDTHAALQAMLDSATGVGLTVVMPPGTYRIDSPLVWPQNWPVTLLGSGVDATIINYTGSGDAIVMSDAGASTVFVKSSIENLTIVGNGSTSVNGVAMRQAYAMELRNVRIREFEVGLRIEQTWSVMLDFVRIDSCSQTGIELHDEANNITAYCCEILDNANGIYTAGARAVLFSGCTIEANTQYGAYITANSADGQSENIVFHGCYIEGNATADIRVILDSGAVSPQTVVVRDCYFVAITSKATVAIRVDQANHVLVDGCDFSVGTATYDYSLYTSDGGTVSGVTWGKNRDASTNGVYRGTGTAYSDETKLAARAWGRFTIAAAAIASSNSFGVASITYVSTGLYEVTLREAMPSTAYCVLASAENGAAYVAMLCSPGQPISTTVFRIVTGTDPATLAEARTVNFSVFA